MDIKNFLSLRGSSCSSNYPSFINKFGDVQAQKRFDWLISSLNNQSNLPSQIQILENEFSLVNGANLSNPDKSNAISALRAVEDYVKYRAFNGVRSVYLTKNDDTLDGMQPLYEKYSGLGDLVTEAIENCLFADKKIESVQFNALCTAISNNDPIKARESKKHINGVFNGINISKDSNGNAEIDRLFSQLLNFPLKTTPAAINFAISHIWGRAYDPSYFSSLWNIVLVPQYINWVIDKNEKTKNGYFPGNILAETLKAILTKFYTFSSKNWSAIKLSGAPIFDPMFVQHGTYSIRVIEPQPNGTFKIISKQVTV